MTVVAIASDRMVNAARMSHAGVIAGSTALALVVATTVVRGAIAVYWADRQFDADLGTIGLMAKHIAEGRAFPIMQYGLQYVLVLESWLAAPLMWIKDDSPSLLAAVPAALNVLTVLLLYIALRRPPSPIGPAAAGLATLPVALPSLGAGQELMKPLGMNIEPLLFTLLLWLVRERPLALGAVAAVGVKNREFVLYAIAALLFLDFVRDRSASLWRPRIVSLVSFAVTWAVFDTLMRYSTPLGPGTTIASLGDMGGNMTKAVSTLCIAPSLMWQDVIAVTGELLPFQYGLRPPASGAAASLGFATVDAIWLWPVLAAALIFATARGVWRAWKIGSSPVTWLGLYLVLTGLQALAVYATTRCGNVGYTTLRYTLLSILIPSGAIALALERERSRSVQAAIAGVCSVWIAVCLAGHVRAAQDLLKQSSARTYAQLAAYLEARGVRYIVTDYWTGYHVAFITGERVRALTNFDRVREHALAVSANADEAVRVFRLREGSCSNGVDVGGFLVCPPDREVKR
jgi:hypothetical protein